MGLLRRHLLAPAAVETRSQRRKVAAAMRYG